ncbi:MAG TPA: hypothetical protein PLE19_08050 [Planctomycetota bacterium]|nr:hypothetical protein [Planctomycetota bacterium]HRR80105.1 hypothetical protein [Planctomycetota bacterium]HRT94880.1 hypothetical protein [Planctomycetota bacterium]
MRTTLAATCALLVGTALAGEVKPDFAQKPTVRTDGAKRLVEFAVNAPTDAEVSILDVQSNVVRHLAAGALGGQNAPPPPLRPGLTQSLEWDGSDDLGQPAKGAPFKAYVRLGAQAVFSGIIGGPEAIASKVYGLATDDQGEVYVATGGGYGGNIFTIKVFDRTGKYLRTIFPYPANLKAGEVEGFGKPALRDGKLSPPQHNALLPWIHPEAIGGFIGSRVQSGVLWLTNGRGELCRIRAADGACIAWGDTKTPAPPAQGPICWAAAPDGRSLYLAGWYHESRKIADGQVFKVDPATGERSPFIAIDVPADNFWAKEKNGWYHYTNWGRKNGLSALHGLAADREGRIYVCDRVNQRLAVYDPAGKLLGSTPVEWPDLVALSPKGPGVYVTTRRIVNGYKAVNEVKLLKLSGWKDGKVLAELTLGCLNAPAMAVDASQDPAVIWLSNVCQEAIHPEGRGMKTEGVTRIEDRGTAFVVTGKLGGEEVLMPEAVVKVWADPFSDDIVVSDGWSGLTRCDGLTGEKRPFPLKGMELAFGPDGRLYVYGQQGWHELVTRFDCEFKPVPFAATGKNTTTLTTTGKDVYGRYGHGWSNKGLWVAPSGRIYVHHMFDWCKYHVSVWDANGQAEKHSGPADGLVGPTDPQGGGLCVDAAGNIYVGLHGAPAGSPAAADKRRTKGAIVKFGPEGGGYVKLAQGEEAEGQGMAWAGSQVGDYVKGALAAYPILAPQVEGGCVCKEGRFDLDPWGRLYIPNALDYYVAVVDNAGNEILRFGYYGNPDSAGPQSPVPEPDVPLGWPMAVSAGQVQRGRLYVADAMNRRVVRLELRWAAEAVCGME